MAGRSYIGPRDLVKLFIINHIKNIKMAGPMHSVPAAAHPPAAQGWTMHWTPNRVTCLRVVVGFAAVFLFGRGPWLNLSAVALTVACIGLDALDGHIARR